MSAAREAILTRIREATRDVPAGEAASAEPGGYRRALDLDGAALVELFAARVSDYRAEVVPCSDGDAAIAAAVAGAAAEQGARRLLVPHDLPPPWLPGDLDPLFDDPAGPLPIEALDGADGVITGSSLGIAETGTIVLDAGPGQGRRALTLVPDLHLCVVKAADIVGSVPEAFDRLAQAGREGRPITFVSGPSATSDIELDRVEGVHGPRRLIVVLAVPTGSAGR
jgi:L-lactate dehydrogenase complex protein LldG